MALSLERLKDKRRFHTIESAQAFLGERHNGHGQIYDEDGKRLRGCRCGDGETVVVNSRKKMELSAPEQSAQRAVANAIIGGIDRSGLRGNPAVALSRAVVYASLVLSGAEEMDGHWRTISGVHVFIKGGVITKGPPSLSGKKTSELSGDDRPRHKISDSEQSYHGAVTAQRIAATKGERLEETLRAGGFAFPGAGRVIARQGAESPTKRFETGRSLSEEERKKVLNSMTDVYKANKLQKVIKGYNRNSDDPIYGYPHTPELFEKSDITGAKMRHYVTLPDGRKAHPSELYPSITQSHIDKHVAEQEIAEKQLAQEAKSKDARITKDKSEANAKYNQTRRTLEGSYFAHRGDEVVRVDGKDAADVAHFEGLGFKKPKPID